MKKIIPLLTLSAFFMFSSCNQEPEVAEPVQPVVVEAATKPSNEKELNNLVLIAFDNHLSSTSRVDIYNNFYFTLTKLPTDSGTYFNIRKSTQPPEFNDAEGQFFLKMDRAGIETGMLRNYNFFLVGDSVAKSIYNHKNIGIHPAGPLYDRTIPNKPLSQSVRREAIWDIVGYVLD